MTVATRPARGRQPRPKRPDSVRLWFPARGALAPGPGTQLAGALGGEAAAPPRVPGKPIASSLGSSSVQGALEGRWLSPLVTFSHSPPPGLWSVAR